MKNTIFFIIVVLLFGCSSAKESMEGTICIIGNEPFTDVAIQVDSALVYKLKASPEVLKELSGNQGKKIKISYCEIDSANSPRTIKVEKHELIK